MRRGGRSRRTSWQLGLPDPALAMLAPALVVDDPAARLVAAAAQLRLGETAAARGVLGSLESREAAELRARSFALDGAYDAGALRR